MEVNGQITTSTERGTLLKKTIKKYSCEKILEIGTWKGLGSTLCILESMNENSKFITIESNKLFFDIASSNLKEFSKNNFKMIYGTIVSSDEVLLYTSNLDLDYTREQWLNDDLINIKLCTNVIDDIFDKIDFLLLDGGEFSTYTEWIKLKDRTTIVAIDDINEIKTKQIYKELIGDSNYELIESSQEGNGFAIFKKLKI